MNATSSNSNKYNALHRNGKGDAPRHIFSNEYRKNYDLIFRKLKKTNKKYKYEY